MVTTIFGVPRVLWVVVSGLKSRYVFEPLGTQHSERALRGDTPTNNGEYAL